MCMASKPDTSAADEAARRAEEEARREAEEARAREAARQAAIRAGQEKIQGAFSGFNDDFYQGREKAYMDFALPELDRQFKDAQEQLVFALSRNGLMQSSVRARRMAELQREADEARQDLTSKARSRAQTTRSNIEASRANLIAQNASIADPSQVASLAQAQASGFSKMPAYEPLGSLFTNVAANLPSLDEIESRLDRTKTKASFPLTGAGSSRVLA